jgi:hypothetical protein
MENERKFQHELRIMHCLLENKPTMLKNKRLENFILPDTRQFDAALLNARSAAELSAFEPP